MEIMMTVWSKKVRLVTIYCPETSENNRYTMGEFYKEFSKLMSHYNTIKDEVETSISMLVKLKILMVRNSWQYYLDLI